LPINLQYNKKRHTLIIDYQQKGNIMLNNTLIKASLLSLSCLICAEQTKYEVPVATKKEKLRNYISLANNSLMFAEQAFDQLQKNSKKSHKCIPNLSKAKKLKPMSVDHEALFANHMANTVYFIVQGLKQGAKMVPNEKLDRIQELISYEPTSKSIQMALNKKNKNTLSKKDCEDFVRLTSFKNPMKKAIDQIKSDNTKTKSEGCNNFLGDLKELRVMKTNKHITGYKKLIGDEALQNYHANIVMPEVPVAQYFPWDLENIAEQFSASCKKNNPKFHNRISIIAINKNFNYI
jgi:hypothetical protein